MNKIIRSLDDVIGEIDYQSLSDLLSVAIEGIRYWGTTDYDEIDYENAKDKLKNQGNKYPCWEEVLGQMLLDGGKIHIIDIEDGEDSEYTKDLTLENLKHGIIMDFLNPRFNYGNANNWRDCDAEEGEHIIQWALFDEIIFG